MSTTATPSRPDAGFTLVEALVAIVILVFGLIAISNLMIVAASSNTVANQSTAATSIASQTLENLKAQPFGANGLLAGGSLTTDTTANGVDYFSSVAVPGVGVVHTRWTIADVDGTTKFITVRSEGTGAVARARSRAEFTTFRVKNP